MGEWRGVRGRGGSLPLSNAEKERKDERAGRGVKLRCTSTRRSFGVAGGGVAADGENGGGDEGVGVTWGEEDGGGVTEVGGKWWVGEKTEWGRRESEETMGCPLDSLTPLSLSPCQATTIQYPLLLSAARKGMGRRNGRRPLRETLFHRVEALFPTVDKIVNYLRSTYPDYQRIKHETLTRLVQEALHARQQKHHHDEDEEILRKRMQTALTSSSESDEHDGTPSTSTVEPSFDLTKTMLRNAYMGTEEKNVELETGKATGIVNEDEAKQSKGSFSNGGDVEVKGKDVTRFRDLGGIKKVLEELNRMLMPFYHPHVTRELGIKPTSGILLHGPPGCGKTILAHAIANETGLPFYHISATDVVSGVSGASEENIRELFTKAHRTAPSIVFIDEIDAIASKRENLSREMEKRIVTQLLTCMHQPANNNYVLVIGATNRPDAIDPALRRPGRFDHEIFIGIPDESSREEILLVLTRNVKLERPIDLRKIARCTPGFVGADLESVVNEAGKLAMMRTVDERYIMGEPPEGYLREPWLPEEVDKAAIKMSDFEKAIKKVQPSTRRKGFSPVPDVKWEDVGGLDLLRQEFEDYIIRPIKYPEDYEGFGVDLATGFLLYGPPGCGKTLIAKAVANAAGANFTHIKVDALTTKRGKEGGWVVERLLNQLLIELDGAEKRKGVFVIGATNRPDVMDPALLRPGRFGRFLYVPLPSPDQRVLILKALARNRRVDASMDLSTMGRSEACENMSGADLAFLMEEAAVSAIRENKASTDTTHYTSTIKPRHFNIALTKVFPSVSDKQKQYYQQLSERFSRCLHINVKESSGREKREKEKREISQSGKSGRKRRKES
ncbi:P-loop containing nucleoside triphosphate hydrolase [Sesbania bispinosa]|nr:P-loop containing nucleoside triphosphate hydrolase [Sesbania bispinosa]